MSQLERTCCQLVGKTNIIRDVLERDDARALCDEAFVSEMRTDYVTDRPLYVAKLEQLRVPETLLNFRFQSIDDVTTALHDVKLFVQHSRATRTRAGGERFVELRAPADEAADAAHSDVSSLRHSSEGGSGASKHAHFDPYPKSVTSLVAQPLQVCSIFEFDMNVRHVTYMHDEVWAVLTNGSVLVLDPEQGKVKRKVKVRERERRESWWSRWLSE